LVKTFPKFDIAGDISGLLDKIVQGVLLLEMRDHPFTDCPVKAAEVMTRDPGIGFGRIVSKLLDKHLEFGRILVGATLRSLFDGFGALDDISLAVGRQVLFFEGLEEWLEQWEGFDVFVRINVAARRVCLSAGTSASSMYSSTVNTHEVTVAMVVSEPSNLSGLVILIDSGILAGCSDSEGVSESGSDCVSDVSSVCLWGTFVSICLWSWTAWIASGEMPRARR